MQSKKHITKKLISVADAVAMNAAPEYWLSVKCAGLHVLSVLAVAKLLFMQNGVNQ